MKHGQAKAFFAIHMVGGFAMLWLCYYYVQLTLAQDLASKVWLKALVETSFLLLTVVWGSVGWDSYKELRDNAPGKNLPSELAASTASLTIALPIFVAIYDFAINWRLGGFVWGARTTPVILLVLAVVVGVVLLLYRRKYRSGNQS